MTERPGPRRLLVGVAAAVVLAVLTACGGIPTSGPVVEGPALDEVESDYIVSPGGPAEGATPREILSGFMFAVRAPQGDYQTARSFLTQEFSATWQPAAGVTIRSSNPTVTEAAGSTAESPRLSYAFETAASVDSAGRYREAASPSDRVAEFAFAQDDQGQWRISEAPPGVILAEIGFTRAFSAVPLYFFDASERYLVPDVRWFATRGTVMRDAVSALLAGPDEWLAGALVSEFPAGTTLGSAGVVVEAGRATVDLSPQAASAGPEALGRMRQQLAATLDIADVALSVGGVALAVQPGGTAPSIDPQPNDTVIVGTGTEFGRGSAAGVVPIEGVTPVLLADGATAATLANDQRSAAYLAGDGSVRFVARGDAAATIIDTRGGLLAPALDPYGFVWSATGGAAGRIEAFDRTGKPVGVVVDDLPANAALASIAMSRDGTRLAVLVDSGGASRLLVFGVARQDGAPTQLRHPLELAAPGIAPVDVAWVDESSLVVLATQSASGAREARLVPIGQPSTPLGVLAASATSVVGGRGGVTGIRALVDGEVLAAGGGGGWSGTGIAATFLGVQQ